MATVHIEHDGGITRLKLDRPNSRNALTTELLLELRAALVAERDDPTTRVVTLTGSGSVFCAGADLKEFAHETSARSGLARVRLVSEVIAAFRNLEAVTIAEVSGAAVGAGWGLALACDLCYATSDATFCLPEVRKGFRLPPAIMNRLVQVAGPVRGAEIALGGAAYTAADGQAGGWVSQVFPDATARSAFVDPLVRDLAASPRSSVSTVKQVLRRSPPGELTPPSEYVWNEE